MVVKGTLIEEPPEIYGLVLAGGRSTRMGRDKSHLMWGGIPLYKRSLQLLDGVCSRSFISCREEQADQFEEADFIIDAHGDAGPLGAILTAMQAQPNFAWLVLAVDLPKVDSELLTQLVAQRDWSKKGTCFRSRSGLVQPLCGVYEPRCLEALKTQLDQGLLALHPLIKAQDFVLIEAESTYFLNINSMSDWESWFDNQG